MTPFAASLLILILCYWRVLSALVVDWVHIDTARHGFAVVAWVLAWLWRDRSALASLPRAGSNVGMALIVWAGIQSLVASLGVELFLGRTSFLIALAGLVLFHFGWIVLRGVLFPLLLLGLAIPLPAIIYNPIVGMLQRVASTLTETVLSIADVPLRWEGTAMVFGGGSDPVSLLNAYGCLRLSMALAFGGLAYARWTAQWKVWARLAAFLMAVFVLAIGFSSLRIVAIAWLDEVKPAWSSLILTHFNGWLVLASVFLAVAAGDAILKRRWRRS